MSLEWMLMFEPVQNSDPPVMYVQCGLRRGRVSQVSWLPKAFAVKGQYLKLRGEDGWLVEQVGTLELDEVAVTQQSHEWRYVKPMDQTKPYPQPRGRKGKKVTQKL